MSTDILGFRAQRRRALAWSGIIFCALIAVLALGVIVGPTPLNIADLGAIASHHLFGSALPVELQTADAIVWDIRLPRLLFGRCGRCGACGRRCGFAGRGAQYAGGSVYVGHQLWGIDRRGLGDFVRRRGSAGVCPRPADFVPRRGFPPTHRGQYAPAGLAVS